ncbi:hypothetical protein LGQ02_13400 [Bacillus shivajii]|uniref:hypothetical protein n=1 Tax=Bacillus shivajii TaxID=1983719 RepID=UPI001CFB4D24|nr:hypothetical protein [Bacillus shivajii]UCZ51851.1 hypothetical protein LGQ02_13400 [Bacillus shivajii]
MFGHQLANFEITEASFHNKWEKLSEREKDLLTFMTDVPDTRQESVERLGKTKYGPFNFYKGTRSLLEDNLLYLIDENGTRHLIVPREVDYFLTAKRNTNNKLNQQKSEAGEAQPNIFELFIHFCIELNKDIQGDTERVSKKKCDDHSYFLREVLKWFEKQSERPLLLMTNWVKEKFDDLVELMLLTYMKVIAKDKNEVYPLHVKRVLYKLDDDSDDVLQSLEGHNYSESTILQVHSQEWLLPRYDCFPTLWLASIFGEIITSGSMVTINISEQTVQKGKGSGVSFQYFETLLRQLPFKEEKDRETIISWWEGSQIIIKDDCYTFFRINSDALKKQLAKKSKDQYGSENVIELNNGLFISNEISKQWEKDISKMNFQINEKRKTKKVKEQQRFTTLDYVPAPKEWDEIGHLPDISFKLMAYKENFFRRLIRQSQVMKIPLLVEESSGDIQLIEVKRLVEEGEHLMLETYDHQKLSHTSIKKLALYNPLEEKMNKR